MRSQGMQARGWTRSGRHGAPKAPPGLVHFARARPGTAAPVFCPHFGPCGGCQLLDISYREELDRKEGAFRALVAASPALARADLLPILGARHPLFWRTSLKIPIARQAGRVVCGFFEPGSHRVVDLSTCVVQQPRLVELVLHARELVRRLRVPVYDETTHRGVLRHLLARVASGTEEMLAGLVVREQGNERVRRLALRLWERCTEAGLVGVVENVNSERTNVVVGSRVHRLAGQTTLLEQADGLVLRTTLSSFAQDNSEQASVQYAEIGRALGAVDGRRVVELYAGYGPIGLRLARNGAQVLAVERNAAAVRQGVEAARLNGLEARIRFLATDAESALADPGTGDADAVVVDPPRRGLTPGVIEQLLAAKVPVLLYVSCNPKTLVRDLERLVPTFAVRCLRLVDLFPRTEHVEAVALLERRRF